MAQKKAETTLEIKPLDQREITFKIVGLTPLYMAKMGQKAQRTLLIGGKRKGATERAQIKHNPEQEFLDSAYVHADPRTLLAFPAPGMKGAMATAALETANITKTSVQRLVYLPDQQIPIWGTPQMKLDVVRSADMNKTPDIRTRAYLPEWATEVRVRYIAPTLNEISVLSLIQNAGIVCGIGDFRVEKGKGSYGTFAVADHDEAMMKEWTRITKEQDRDVQELAMADPEMADDESRWLLDQVIEERIQRGLNADGSDPKAVLVEAAE